MLPDTDHCACFNIGLGSDGSPLLSWSHLYAFYRLPDGSTWAEHDYLHDAEDLVRGVQGGCKVRVEVA